MQNQGRMEDFQVTIQEINNILKSLDRRKAMGLEGVSGWILKECRDELKDKLHSIIIEAASGRRANAPKIKNGEKRDQSFSTFRT